MVKKFRAHGVRAQLCDRLNDNIAYLAELARSKLADKWEKLMDKAEQLGKTMRSQVGEAITRRNECGSELEASFVREVSSAVADTLKDYYDFLQMKRTRNVTITSYLEKFPGLVHFMYIDRSTDMLTAPCLCQTNDVAEEGATGSHRASLSLKERVWEMYEHAQRHLAKVESISSFKTLWFSFSSSSFIFCRATPPCVQKPAISFTPTLFGLKIPKGNIWSSPRTCHKTLTPSAQSTTKH
eukprot:m.252558 g.252558  ORF g.252558 m.252558 type:complete len:240 (+) comp22664_c0_seq8:2232-2951(+)